VNPDQVQVQYTTVPASAFPFTIELLDTATRQLRWKTTVTGPGALQVPSKHDINDGKPLTSRFTWADGTVTEEGPGGS
jgi:hypothetical protein